MKEPHSVLLRSLRGDWRPRLPAVARDTMDMKFKDEATIDLLFQFKA
jgi:hypothetical protein